MPQRPVKKRAAPLPWLSWFLRHLPAPMLSALDAWSLRVARRRAARRRALDAA